MDDNGREEEFGPDTLWRFTPKGFLMACLTEKGIDEEEAKEIWHKLEAFCIKESLNPDASYSALIFDGHGGVVIGVEPHAEEA